MSQPSAHRAHLTRLAITSLTAATQLACSGMDETEKDVRKREQEYVTGTCGSTPVPIATATASTTQSPELGIENAIDGDPNTRWSSDFSDEQEVILDLGAPRYVTTVALDFETATSASYTVSISYDGLVWGYSTGAYDSSVGPRTDELTFERVGRYIRFASRARTTKWGVSLHEITVHGDEDPTCQHEIVNNQIYRIENATNGKAVDVAEWGTWNGANVHQWDFVGGDNQKWRLSRQEDGSYEIRSELAGKCLDIGGDWNGASAQIWDCHGGDNQRFYVETQGEDGVTLVTKHSGKCLDVEAFSNENGGDIHTWDCTRDWNQIFKLEELTPGGEEAWARSGRLTLDSAGNAYRQLSTSTGNELSGIDLRDGGTLWTLDEDESFYIAPECGRRDVLIGVTLNQSRRRVAGIHPLTGESLWEENFDGALVGQYPSLRCDSDADYVLVTWDGGRKYVSLGLDGAVTWHETFSPSAYAIALGPDVVLFRSYDYANKETSVEGRDALTGDLLWTRSLANNVYFSACENELYLTDRGNHELSRVDPVNGSTLWVADSFTGPHINASFWVGLLTVSDASGYAFLDPETGEQRWRLDSDQGYPNVLSENYLATSTIDTGVAPGVYRHVIRDASTGEVALTFPETSSYYSRYFVSGDELYVAHQNHLDKYSLISGEHVWSFSLEGEELQPQHFSEILEVSRSEVLVAHYHPMVRYAHSGLISLNQETGEQNWGFFAGTFLQHVTSTSDRVYLNLNYSSEIAAIAR